MQLQSSPAWIVFPIAISEPFMHPRFSDFAKTRMSATAPACAVLLLLWMGGAMGMQVTGYSAAANDRFQSGFPTAPVESSNVAFIGLGYNWSGFSWSTNVVSTRYKGFAMLSPLHFLTAQHFEYGSEQTQGVQILGADGALATAGTQTISNLSHGLVLTNGGQTNYDLAVGTLGSRVSAPLNMARYAVLDLNDASGSDTLNNYSGLQIFLTGRSSTTNGSLRIASTSINLVANFNSDSKQSAIRTTQVDVGLEVGDSGYGAYHGWVNPNGGKELVILGTNSAVDATNKYNYTSFLGTAGAMAAANSVITQQGFALKVRGNSTNTWVGSSSTSIGVPQSWGLNRFASAPSDKFVRFNAPTASNRTVTVDTNHNLRGLYFTDNASAADPFTFNGSSTLTIGRGGVTNYDNDRQVFNAPIALGDHQYWDAGSGGVAVSNIATNGRLLEIRAGPQSLISGNISGNGSLALESGTLTLNGTSSLTGTIWAHDGNLRVNGSLASVASVRIDTSATLSGSGRLSHLQGSGTVAPGASKGILRAASINPASGLDFAFEFSQATTVFGNATSSGNDLLRLDSGTPFSGNFTASNSVGIFLDVPGLQAGQKFTGGFFTDQSTDFFDRVQGASFTVYLRDSSGNVTHNGQSYSVYSGPLEISIATTPQTANFGAGDIVGRILEISVADTVAAWAETAFPEGTPPEDRLPDADPNNDGVVNWIAYALRLDPLETPSDQLPKAEVVQTGEEKQLLFQFRRNRVASDVIYRVEVSDDLVEWFEFTGPVEVLQPDPDGDGGAEVVAVAVPIDSVDAKKFVRLRALAP